MGQAPLSNFLVSQPLLKTLVSKATCGNWSHKNKVLLTDCSFSFFFLKEQKLKKLAVLYFFYGSKVYLKQTFKIYVFLVKLRSILEADFLNLQIYIQSQKYTWSILFELMHFLRCIFEVDFLNLCIYVQTQKYTSSRLSKQTCLFSNQEAYLKQTFYTYAFMFKLRSMQEVDFPN